MIEGTKEGVFQEGDLALCCLPEFLKKRNVSHEEEPECKNCGRVVLLKDKNVATDCYRDSWSQEYWLCHYGACYHRYSIGRELSVTGLIKLDEDEGEL